MRGTKRGVSGIGGRVSGTPNKHIMDKELTNEMINELQALETAATTEITGLGNLGGTVDETISLGVHHITGQNPDGGDWTGTLEINVGVTITQPAPGPEKPKSGASSGGGN